MHTPVHMPGHTPVHTPAHTPVHTPVHMPTASRPLSGASREGPGRPGARYSLHAAAGGSGGLALASPDLREFERVPGLKLANWAAEIRRRER